ncbi:MAG: TRAP transporter small permease [Lachnospirales bacterium]
MRKIQNILDKASASISAIVLGVMMVILFTNIILRYVPNVGGFKWYMEGSQYLNVWVMFIVGISISVKGEHLSVNVLLDALKGRTQVVAFGVVSFFTTLFYIGLTYGTIQLASRSKQFISTMQPLKMSYVYWVIPILTMICAVGVIIEYIIRVQDFVNKKEEK